MYLNYNKRRGGIMYKRIESVNISTAPTRSPNRRVDDMVIEKVDCFILFTLLLVQMWASCPHLYLRCTFFVPLGLWPNGVGRRTLQVGSEVTAVGVLALLTLELHSQKRALCEILLAPASSLESQGSNAEEHIVGPSYHRFDHWVARGARVSLF